MGKKTRKMGYSLTEIASPLAPQEMRSGKILTEQRGRVIKNIKRGNLNIWVRSIMIGDVDMIALSYDNVTCY